MKISPEKLPRQLAESLSPIYLISGDEPLLVLEAADAVRKAAHAAGFSERELFVTELGFDWEALRASRSALSLFADRRLLELRMTNGKPGEKGSRVLVDYAADPPQDCVLLVITPKLDRAGQNSKWATALARAGCWIPVWPVEEKQLPAWIRTRMRAAGLLPDREAVQLVAERVEGNLLAAHQEIEKLRLLNGPGAVDGDAVRRAVSDSARFDVFDLADAALEGRGARAARILDGLRSEGVEPVLILWALTRELRTLASLAFAISQGQNVDSAMAKAHIWSRRKPAVKSALARQSLSQLHGLLMGAGRVDRMIKGALPGRVWDELLALVAGLSGVRVL